LVNQIRKTWRIHEKTGEVCGITGCSPQYHALLTIFYIGFQHACFAVRFMLYW